MRAQAEQNVKPVPDAMDVGTRREIGGLPMPLCFQGAALLLSASIGQRMALVGCSKAQTRPCAAWRRADGSLVSSSQSFIDALQAAY